MKITWETHNSSKNCLLGRWLVGKVHYTAFTSVNDLKKWQANCYLPGIKTDLGRFENEEAAIEKLENAVAYWYRGI